MHFLRSKGENNDGGGEMSALCTNNEYSPVFAAISAGLPDAILSNQKSIFG
jgi:hypothetical protein